jgi:hypothetical protein
MIDIDKMNEFNENKVKVSLDECVFHYMSFIDDDEKTSERSKIIPFCFLRINWTLLCTNR